MVDVVVDASVIVKRYLEEEYQREALLIRDRYTEGAIFLHAPALLPYEVLNALRYGNVYNAEELVYILEAKGLLRVVRKVLAVNSYTGRARLALEGRRREKLADRA